ncbi:alpha/beta-tubulin-N-acetyltransferase 9 isoform X2 [Plodia interpunctella]|uniref:alpha/beta-tubulin-N-acetyltransferase 9 isoform X2 n=1 Tax=Plodia interpunctella TaxID=58824 RepID=UPI002367BBB9|nr:alpha/beta-tubulin-N-acetyltransferase 9 isoform X2 [Plodia interpunctella]
MKLNYNTKIVGTNIVLVPYRKHHVPKYHMWMKSEELQKLTASEPLTLEEEYSMQESWRDDEDKCTFIILTKGNEVDEVAMIGDTNIFITDKENKVGEIEIMIAEQSAQGRRLGWEAVILMLLYGIQYIGLKVYEAKISSSNHKSIQMFKKLGFEEKSNSVVFQEITFEKNVCDEWTGWLKKQFKFSVQDIQ